MKPLAKSKHVHRCGLAMVWGVFLMWVLKQGGYWTGRYKVAALTEFVGMDLRVGAHIRTQDVAEVDFDESNVFFPLKALYDRAHGTLEGLSAPYGSVHDVAPQGLEDMGTSDDLGPVGQPLGSIGSR